MLTAWGRRWLGSNRAWSSRAVTPSRSPSVSRPLRRAKPRVVFVNHCARLSGGELALLRLLTALEQVDRHVILGEDGPLVRRLHEKGISVEVLPMRDDARDLHRDEVTPGSVPGKALLHTSAYAAALAR